ncbi:hypothetical protein MNEG_12084 [Monoraphidium neglectum]|uniref:Protease Do-like PDZ domain-containing protein n=1 Tax=Monoraphidium neglectum TaxID=145388 RepID=A0A0D2J7W6_9CHLO|nr:hypothetical protein MNEG_12084 [Monoraphidium neglectum]KIY95877.1 hypothetical protein MNEG_12084 [Monoraphidium neglectum]|eukprot:XP_013894897.1 hypothetical protein MNEG_12084 [Monoraphidium neglectum]
MGKAPPRKKAKVEATAEDEQGAPTPRGEDASSGPDADTPAPASARPRRGGGAAAAAAEQPPPPPGDQPARRHHRRQGGAGTTSAQQEAEGVSGGKQAPLQPIGQAFPGRRGGPNYAADSDSIMEAVVKVFCIHTEPNFSLPWQRKRQYSSSSSGFIIQGRRILTNAHCVKVKRRGSDKKFVASVLAVGTECDIAMLTVEDEEFWRGAEPVEFGDLPSLQAAVTVVGYPIGGDTMSVTSGVVSRIEVTSYVHGAAELLGIQIDAAINSGNSGGPAFDAAGRCVGIAFQSLKHEDAENIGYIIPVPVIQHFITDYERNGAYTGFPCLGTEWQRMENPDLRKALLMKARSPTHMGLLLPDMKGVLVRRVDPTAPVSKVLRQFDILMAFDGVAIANDGTVPFRSGERISFSYLVSQKYTNESATLKVLQGGKERTVTVNLQAPVRLIPFHIKGKPPSYFIVAGLVFTAVSVPYLKSEYGKEFDYEAPVRLLDKMLHAQAERPDQQVVVLSQVLAAETNIGYEDMLNTSVSAGAGTYARSVTISLRAAGYPLVKSSA